MNTTRQETETGVRCIQINPGRRVLCDFCDQEFTDSPEAGGFMFGRKAVGPCCVARIERSAEGYGEAHLIGARCPDGVPFSDWVRDAVREPVVSAPRGIEVTDTEP